MSYDISLEPPLQPHIEVGNYTSNIRPMFNLAFNVDYWVDVIDGKLAHEVFTKIDDAVVSMESHPNTYQDINPENGWGDYPGALEFLKKLRDMCWENSNHIIRIDK